MSARPGSWHLLGVDSDPLPGDSYDVSTEARHYATTAQAIHDQVARLRTIAEGSNELVGKYAPALADSARDLADHLDDTEGRFDTVAKQLKIWDPVLEHGMSQSLSLLHEAESAQSTINANQPPHTPVDKTDDKAVSADEARGNRLSGAEGDLNGIVSRFHTLMSEVDSSAESVAKAISDAANDNLKDSWWDKHVRKWIHDHADLLKFIADVLTWIATAIIIAIVIFGTGGLGLAMLLTAGALLLHTMLAANGDGSWVDVGLDVFALATMGAGKVLSTGAKSAYALDEGVTAFGKASTSARAALADADGILGKSGAWLTKSNFAARNLRGMVAGGREFSAVMRTEFEGGSWLARLTMGDKEAAGLYRAVTEKIGAQQSSGLLLNSSKGMLNLMRPVFVSGTAVDFTTKVLNPAFPREGLHEAAQVPTPFQLPLQGLDAVVPDSIGNLKPPLTGLSTWVEEHTVSHGGYW